MICKRGDIAFIKKAIRQENIGLIVQCTKYLGYYLRGDYMQINGELWVAPHSDNYWLIESPSGSINTLFGMSKVAYGPDTWLSPIKPDCIDTDEDTDIDNKIEDEVNV